MIQKYSSPENKAKKKNEIVANDTLQFLLNFSKSLESKKLLKKTILIHKN
jgi:hypothetical protein